MNPQLTQGHFYGQTLSERRVAGFALSETSYAPRARLPRHSHELPYFCLILGGTYTETFGRCVRACQPSLLIHHPADELHAQSFDDAEVRLFRVEIGRARLDELREIAPRLESAVESRSGLMNALAHRLYQEFRAPDSLSPLAVEGLALELVAATARCPARHDDVNARRSPPAWLARARDLVKSRAVERFTLTEVARDAGVHPVTLAREFRRHYGCTVGEMVRRVRVRVACRELLKPDATLACVALAAGFYDQSHLTRTFKRLTGLTPAQYRANFRRG